MTPNPQRPLNRQEMQGISSWSTGAQECRDGGDIRMCTVNVGTMVKRSREVVEMLARRSVYFCCVQEVQYKGTGCRVFGSGEEKYKFWWSGEKNRAGGVGVLVRDEVVEDVIEVEIKTPICNNVG
jgi:exonuclease III